MVVVFILLSFVGILILAMGFGVITSGVSDAASSVGNYTANTTHWTGFTSTINSYPLLIWLILGGMIAFGVWQFVKRWKVKRSGE